MLRFLLYLIFTFSLIFQACDNENEETWSDIASAQDQIPLPIRQGLKKLDNELCDVWDALNGSNALIRQQKTEIEQNNLIIAALLTRIEELEKLTNNHTHEYYLSHVHGGVGPRTKTSRPKLVQDILAIAQPLQIKREKTSTRVVKQQ